LVVLDYNLLLHYVVRVNEVVLLWANYLDWLLAHAWEPLVPMPPEWVVATTMPVIVFLGLCRFFDIFILGRTAWEYFFFQFARFHVPKIRPGAFAQEFFVSFDFGGKLLGRAIAHQMKIFHFFFQHREIFWIVLFTFFLNLFDVIFDGQRNILQHFFGEFWTRVNCRHLAGDCGVIFVLRILDGGIKFLDYDLVILDAFSGG
jgi:hypothetical protein